MICFRRTALRVLSTASPSSSTSIRSRSIISLSKASPYTSTPRTVFPSSALPLQRRWASEAAETQSEPEADGAAEAEHGDNSIAASAESEAEDLTESTKETASSATETARSAASGISHAASTAAQSVAGTAESLGAAAGFGAGKSSYSAPGSDLAPSTTLYVGNLFFDVRAEDLRKEFSRAGPIKEAKIIHDQRGLSKGFGYLEFENQEDAQKAIELFNMQTFEGRRLSVQFSSGRSNPNTTGRRNDPNSADSRPLHPPTKTLFIGNMSFDMSDRDLNALFKSIKNVIDVRVAIDRRTGQPRGFAHADFMDVESAIRAREELNGKEVVGRRLRADYSTSTGRSAVTGGASTAGPGRQGVDADVLGE